MGTFRSLGFVLFVVHLPVLANVPPSPGPLSAEGSPGEECGFWPQSGNTGQGLTFDWLMRHASDQIHYFSLDTF